MDFRVLMITQLFDDDISYRNSRGGNNLIKVTQTIYMVFRINQLKNLFVCVCVHTYFVQIEEIRLVVTGGGG